MPRSTQNDPKNQAPEVTPDDQWGDLADLPVSEAPASSIVPARRTLKDRPSDTRNAEVGLRIAPALTRSASTDPPVRLEVQEANREVIRLEQKVKTAFKASGDPPLRLVVQEVNHEVIRLEQKVKTAFKASADPPLRLEVREMNREVIRLEQEVRTPFKVDRQITVQENLEAMQAEGNLQGDGSERRAIQQIPHRWIFGMIAAVTLIVIAGLLLLPLINSTNAPSTRSNPKILSIVEEEKIEGTEAMDRLLERQQEALQIFRAYIRAVHFDQVGPLVVDGRSIRDTLQKHWSPLEVPKDWSPDPDCAWVILDLGNKAYGILEGLFPDQTPFNAYFSYQGDRMLLDWKATTAFSTASFSQLNKGLGDASEIRGILSCDEFYSSVWPEADYQSYRLTTPDEEFTIWCYARRGGSAYSALAPLFTSGELTGEKQIDRKVTLSLARGPAETLPNQWLIGELLQIDWGTH